MSISERLRSMARAIRADAEERASMLDAMADEHEADDPLESIDDVAVRLGIKPRALKENLVRRGVGLEKIGTTYYVRRSQITERVEPRAKKVARPKVGKPANDAQDEARAAVEAVAARMRASR